MDLESRLTVSVLITFKIKLQLSSESLSIDATAIHRQRNRALQKFARGVGSPRAFSTGYHLRSINRKISG